MKAITFVAIIFVVSVLSGCKSETTSLSGGGVVDTTAFDYRLVGTWSTFDGTMREEGCVSGIQFGFNKSMRFLGVNVSTGVLAAFENENQALTDLLSADNGIITMVHSYCGMASETLHVRYNVDANKLILLDGSPRVGPGTLYRTRLGLQVTIPHPYVFSVKINNVETQSRTVLECTSWSPSIRIENPTTISLDVRLPYPWEELYVLIDSFAGPGKYTIKENRVDFHGFCDDQGQSNYVFDSVSHNTVTIDEFDLTLNRCSGRFELDIGYEPGESYYLRFRDGVFSLPIEGALQSNQLPESALRRRTIPIAQ
jgi:hypothetical protein